MQGRLAAMRGSHASVAQVVGVGKVDSLDAVPRFALGWLPKEDLDRAERNVNHLKTHFAGWKAVNISTPQIRTYIDRRQKEGAENGTINRELAALKRMFFLALQAEKLLRPTVHPPPGRE